MKHAVKTVVMGLAALIIALFAIACDSHEHTYKQTTVEPSCTERGYSVYTCSCGDNYYDNYVTAKGHNYVDHYCTDCKMAQPPRTFDDLIFFYEDDMIGFTSKIIDSHFFACEFSVCIVNNIETYQNIQMYNISPTLNQDEIEGGLFVKCVAKYPETDNIAFIGYYNYALQLKTEYTQLNVTVQTENYKDSWQLLPLADNNKIYFEFSIIEK